MKKWLVVGLLALAVGVPRPAQAEIGALDIVPAATLLFPYVEADLQDANGVDTLISVRAASATAVLANVVLWTDAGIPALSFNLYLTGFDVHSFRLRDVLNGTLPQTASAGQDPQDVFSPKGARSQDINFPGCASVLPPGGASAAVARAAMTGQPGSSGKCTGLPSPDGHARGSITVDVVSQCSTLQPGEAGYFTAGGTGVATNSNQLLGEFVLLHPAARRAQGFSAVHIEADGTSPVTTSPGMPTFYGRLVDHSTADNREPLATVWAVPYLTGRTELLVWRESPGAVAPFTCAQQPASFPLPTAKVVAFDMQESAVILDAQGLFPRATQRVMAGSAPGIPLTAKSGFMELDLNAPDGVTPMTGLLDPWVRQSWMLVVTTPESVPGDAPFTTSNSALPLDTAFHPAHARLPSN